MNSSEILELIVKLNSAKAKERNDALNSLESLVDTNRKFTINEIVDISDSLLPFIDNEKASYLKNLTSVTELRLQTASYVLRKIISINPEQLKYKFVKQLFQFLSSRILGFKDTENPLLFNCSIILQEIIAVREHRDHITRSDWKSLLQDIVAILREEMEISNDKLTLGLVQTLGYLISDFNITTLEISQELSYLLQTYFQVLRKEIPSTHLMLEISNNFIILSCTSSISDCIRVAKSIMKISSLLLHSNHQSVRDQLLIYSLISSEFFKNGIFECLEVTNDPEIPSALFSNELAFYITTIMEVILNDPSRGLHIDDIDFTVTSRYGSWFEFDYIRLKKGSDSRLWLSLLSLVKLLDAYFVQKRFCNLSDGGIANKKRKMNLDSLGNILRRCQTFEAFANALISASDTNLQVLGLQLFAFYIENYPLKGGKPIDIPYLIRLYDKNVLAPWVSLVLKTLIEHDIVVSEDELCHIIEINIHKLKDREISTITSQTLSSIFSFVSNIVKNNSILQMIKGLFELAQINGPAKITNASLELWVSISECGQNLHFKDKKAGDMIIMWLIGKWSDIIEEEVPALPSFVSFLLGERFYYDYPNYVYDKAFAEVNLLWSEKIRVASMIMKTGPTKKSPRRIQLRQRSLPFSISSIELIIGSLLVSLERLDLPGMSIKLCTMVGYCITVYDYIKEIPQLESSSKKLKYQTKRVLEDISASDYEEAVSVIETINNFCISPSATFFFEEFKGKELTSLILERTEVCIRKSADDAFDAFSEFGQIRKENIDQEGSGLSYESIKTKETEIQKLFIFTLNLASGFKSNRNLNFSIDQAIRFLENLKAEQFIYCCYTLMQYFEYAEITKIQPSLITKLLRLLGNNLLASYKFERLPFTFTLTSRLLKMFGDLWLTKSLDNLSADFSDIFNWLYGCGRRHLIAEENSLINVCDFLIYTLKFKDSNLTENYFEIFDLCFHLLENSTQFVMLYSMNSLVEYLKISDPTTKIKCYEKLLSSFHNPQVSCEAAFCLCMILSDVASISYPLLILCLCQYLRNYKYHNFKPYVKDCFTKVAGYYNIEDFRGYLLIKLELFKFWKDELGDLQEFPYELLNYEIKDDFLMSERHLLFSINQSSLKSSTLFNRVLAEVIYTSEDDMVLETISYSIPLSFTKFGRKQGMALKISTIFDDSIIYHQSLLIIYRFLSLCDLSSESVFTKSIPNASDLPIMAQLVSENSEQLYPLVNISVSASAVVHEIMKLNEETAPNTWSTTGVIFLVKHILKDLSRAVNEEEKILTLRRLKLLIFLAHTAFESEEVIKTTLDCLVGYITTLSIHDDVCLIFTGLLDLFNGPLFNSSLFPNLTLSAYCQAAKFYSKEGHINQQLKDHLIGVVPLLPDGEVLSTLIVNLVSVIKGENYRIDMTVVHAALEYISTNVLNNLRAAVLDAIFLLLEISDDLVQVDKNFKTNQQVASTLLDIREGKNAEKFSLFKARYLGIFFLQNGDSLQKTKFEFERSIECDSKRFTNSTLYFVFDRLSKTRELTTDLQESIFIDTIFGFALFQYNTDPLKNEGLVDFENHLSNLVKEIIPVDLFTTKLLHPDDIVVEPWDKLYDKANIAEMSTVYWCKSIALSILDTLSEKNNLFIPLMAYIYKFPDFSIEILNFLLIFFATSTGNLGVNQLITFITKILGRDDVFYLSTDKQRILLHLVFVLRTGYRYGIKQLEKIYRSLDVPRVYELASKAGLPKFALLLYEDHFMEVDNKRVRNWKTDSKILSSIYESLGDADLVYGLPVQPSFDYAVAMLNKSGRNPWEKIMFNSAHYDAAVLLGDPNFSGKTLLNSLASNSLNGLSQLFNEHLSHSDKVSSVYGWSWRLNKWEIPAPDAVFDEDEVIYKFLKEFQDDPGHVQLICDDLMLQVVDQNVDDGLLKKLAFLVTAESITGSHPEEFINHNEEFEVWSKYVEFSEIESILSARRLLLENLNRINTSPVQDDQCLSITAFEIMRYGELARFHNERQKSVNCAAYFDGLIKAKYSGDTSLGILRSLSTFESACTLWGQGETVIPIAMLKDLLKRNASKRDLERFGSILVGNSLINAYLVKWTSESREEKFESILLNYVKAALRDIKNVKESKTRAKIYHILGYFCYKQIKITNAEDEIERQEKLLITRQTELKDLKMMIQDKDADERERKDAKRFFQRMQLQMQSDKESYELLKTNRKICIEKALEFFLKSIATHDDYDDQDIDILCALWLEYSDDEVVNKIINDEIPNVPGFKFIPWINQLVSRLSNDSTTFQEVLQKLIVTISFRHPYHSLYYIMNLRAHKLYDISKTDSTVHSRSVAADKVWNSLSKNNPNFLNKVLDPIQQMSTNAISLATEKVSLGKTKILNLGSLKIGNFWINKLKTLNLPLPTLNNPRIAADGKYDFLPRMCSIDPTVQISPSGISLPKIVKVKLTDGTIHKMLLKGSSDDLRQDAIMEQVFEKVNLILQHDKETHKRNLRIRTYKVVPLGPQAGMIEFVANSIALSDILRSIHGRNDKISFDEARSMMKEVQPKSKKERIDTYLQIAKDTKPVFRYFFYDIFPNVDDWYNSRLFYTRGLVTTSIVGYILGLGDRHLNNILIDKKTGEPIHIDLGVAFDQGKLLPVPELVPFRLTRDMVDGLGITGVEGSFTKSCEHVFRVLRENVEKIIGILDVLKYDPLYSWAISPIRRKKLQEFDNEKISAARKSVVEGHSSDAVRAVKGVETKLTGNGLSVEASVQELIQEATDYKNLALIYLGWAPFY